MGSPNFTITQLLPPPLWHLISHNPFPLPGQQSVQTDKSAPEVSTTWSPGADVDGHGDDDDDSNNYDMISK